MQISTMNKSLVFLAAAAWLGSASAQTAPAAASTTSIGSLLSGVSLSGVIDVGPRSTSNSDSTKNKIETTINNTTTSLIYFKGQKEFNSGTKAYFSLELDFNASQSSTANGTAAADAYTGTPFNGEQYVALAGKLGDIKLGAPNSAALAAGLAAQPFGTALGSGYSPGFGRLGTASFSGVNQFIGNTTGRIIRHEKTMMYTTPKFNGFSGSFEYAAPNDYSGAVTSNSNGNTTWSVAYGANGFNAVYAHAYEQAGSNGAAGAANPLGTTPSVSLPAGTDISWDLLGANYTMGSTTVYAGYTTTKQGSTPTPREDSSSWNVAAKYVGIKDFEFMANYLARQSRVTNVADATLLGLGVNYYLDTSTNLYLRYEGLKFSSTPVAGDTVQNVWATGIRYQF